MNVFELGQTTISKSSKTFNSIDVSRFPCKLIFTVINSKIFFTRDLPGHYSLSIYLNE